jgi:hypothetical protein
MHIHTYPCIAQLFPRAQRNAAEGKENLLERKYQGTQTTEIYFMSIDMLNSKL